ncbi:MAG: hypothetical protein IH587_10010 [Anaerolineae bacterium]|nr:hypothetical protein [Anaerolineae bacterium]
MTPSKNRSDVTSETGQIPRHLMEAYRDAADALRDSAEQDDSGSITGVFKMRKRAEGDDQAKDGDNNSPASGNVVEPAQQ